MPLPQTIKPLNLPPLANEFECREFHFRESTIPFCGPEPARAQAQDAPAEARRRSGQADTGDATQPMLSLRQLELSEVDAAYVFLDSETPGRAPG